jgi:hypothetical protein
MVPTGSQYCHEHRASCTRHCLACPNLIQPGQLSCYQHYLTDEQFREWAVAFFQTNTTRIPAPSVVTYLEEIRKARLAEIDPEKAALDYDSDGDSVDSDASRDLNPQDQGRCAATIGTMAAPHGAQGYLQCGNSTQIPESRTLFENHYYCLVHGSAAPQRMCKCGRRIFARHTFRCWRCKSLPDEATFDQIVAICLGDYERHMGIGPRVRAAAPAGSGSWSSHESGPQQPPQSRFLNLPIDDEDPPVTAPLPRCVRINTTRSHPAADRSRWGPHGKTHHDDVW